MKTAEHPPFTEADITLLHAVLSGDVVKCNAKHGEPWWSPTCSIEVTHRARVTCAGNVYNICANEVAEMIECFEHDIHCGGCDRLVAECWIVNPI